MKEHMLTTIDNPFHPFTQFDEWLAYDIKKGHHTLSLLARVTKTSPDLSELDQSLAIEFAIDELIELNPSGILRKVTKDSKIKAVSLDN